MNDLKHKIIKQNLRKNRVRANIHGTSLRPRMSVHVSNIHISVQIIDDDRAATIVSATTIGKDIKGNMADKAAFVGKEIAEKAKKAKVKKVVLDRGAKLYHGRIKALADAARNGGLEF